MNVRVTFTGKCTTCRKTFEVSPEQESEMREVGCAFSPCCHAVATIEAVTIERDGASMRLPTSRKT